MRLLRDSSFLAACLGHFLIDVFSGQISVVLVFVSVDLGMGNADIGLVTMLYLLLSSLTQPGFGWLADRFGPAIFATGGILWMAAAFAGVALLPGWGGLVFLVMSAIGFAAFHPAATERATARGRAVLAGQAATAASLFFLFGQAGLGLGPAAGGLLLDRFGLPGLLMLSALGLPLALYGWPQFQIAGRETQVAEQPTTDEVEPRDDGHGALRWGAIALFALLIALRTTPQQAAMTFIPKLLQDRGFGPVAYGLIASLFMIGSSVGGVAGGVIADRWGRRRTIAWTVLAAVPLLFFYPVASGPLMYLLVLGAGALTGASHSIIVVLAQALVPERMAMASGFTLGFMFASGSLGTYLIGLLAEAVPLATALQLGALLALGAVALTPTLTAKNGFPSSEQTSLAQDQRVAGVNR